MTKVSSDGKIFYAGPATRMSSNLISTFSFDAFRSHQMNSKKFNFFWVEQTTRQMRNNNRNFPSFSWLSSLCFARSPPREYFEKIPRFNVFRTGEMLSSTNRSFIYSSPLFLRLEFIKRNRKGRSQKVSGEKTLINKWKMVFSVNSCCCNPHHRFLGFPVFFHNSIQISPENIEFPCNVWIHQLTFLNTTQLLIKTFF